MKRITFILLAAAIAMSVWGKDVIVLNNGDLIDAKVIEVGKAEVKYKKASNPNGPTYTIDKANIIAINYQNGDKDVFNQLNAKGEARSNGLISQPIGRIDPVIAEDNQKLIDYYNSSTIKHKKKTPSQKKLKLTEHAIVCLGITPESQLSDSNVEISLECSKISTDSSYDYWWNKRKVRFVYDEYEYRVCIRNKTDKFIYVDTQSSFRNAPRADAEPFYSGVSVTNTSGNNKGVGLNLGAITGVLGVGGAVGSLANGIKVGGGNSSTMSVTESNERVLIVPPHSKVSMPSTPYIDPSKKKSTKICELIDATFLYKHPRIEKWAYTPLNKSYIDFATKYFITYSTTQDFSSYTCLSFGMYPRGLFGSDWGSFEGVVSDKAPCMIGASIWIDRNE